MLGLKIFSIPIYLRSGERYYEEHKNYENRKIEQLALQSGRSIDEERTKLRGDPWLYDYFCFWPPWELNDIVWFCVVYYDKRSFTAYSYNLNRRRIHRDPRKRGGSIVFGGKIGGPAFAGKPYLNNRDPNNEELRLGLLDLLSEINEAILRKGWYIDLQYWKNIIKKELI